MKYERRVVDDELDQLFPHVAALAVDGPKLVGKTTTAQQRVTSVLTLDTEPLRTAIAADPQQLLLRPRPLLIDEWQNVPEVWNVVRHAVDANPAGGQFLFAGSATPVPDAAMHTGAGRIGRLRMRPLSLVERGLEQPKVSMSALLSGRQVPIAGGTELRLADYAREIVGSGFPPFRQLEGRALRFQLDSYIRNAVERDIPELGVNVRKPDALLNWLRAYAAATSTTASYSQILDAATAGESDKPARTTTATYRDALSRLWLLDPVSAWSPTGSAFARLGRAPKHHLADPALAARLLGATAESLLDGEGQPLGGAQATLLGSLFESLTTLCVRVYAQAAEATVAHFRTRNGDHEVDLVVIRDDGKIVAIEVKLAGTVSDNDTRHLRWLKEQMGDRLLDAIVVNTGQQAYRRKDGIGVVPLALLGP